MLRLNKRGEERVTKSEDTYPLKTRLTLKNIHTLVSVYCDKPCREELIDIHSVLPTTQ